LGLYLIASPLKEEFHSLFEKSNNLGDGILELTDWLKKGSSGFEVIIKTN